MNTQGTGSKNQHSAPGPAKHTMGGPSNQKGAFDFNLTQPIQLSSQGGVPTSSSKQGGGFGVTQPGLQKILRSLSKQNNAASGAGVGETRAAASSHAAEGGSGTHSSGKSASGVSQRKSSSHKSRRMDPNLNMQPVGQVASTSSTKHAGHHHLPQTTTSQSLGGSQDQQTSKGGSQSRTFVKNHLGSEGIQKLTGRASRNPRVIDGISLLPPPSQSNTNPVMGNAGLSIGLNQATGAPPNAPIGPTMGKESGGGHGAALGGGLGGNSVARSSSGKRLQRSSDQTGNGGNSHHGGQAKQLSHGSNNNAKFFTPTGGSQAQVADSRFAQRPHKTTSGSSDQYTSSKGVGGQANSTNPTASGVQVLHSEPIGQGHTSGGVNAKYFSQRLHNQRSNKNTESQDANKPLRSSKDELLRAFIKPAETDQRDRDRARSGGEAESTAANLKHRISNARQQGKTSTAVQGGLNELGGFSGASLDKIQAKAGKLKQGLSQSNSTEEKLSQSMQAPNQQQSKGTLSQAANSFRAKLLRSYESQKEGSGLPNKLEQQSKGGSGLLNKTQKVSSHDEPQVIQTALNSLKKSLVKQQQQSAASSTKNPQGKTPTSSKPQKEQLTRAQKRALEEAKRKEKEKNLGPDDIVEYRGMKMTVSQREEYMEMEEEQICKFRQNYYPAKFASKKNGVVVTYAANTHQGMVRNYNEDRVSIILNIIKPKFKSIDFWPRCSFFAIYDGHGGAQCADFLRDQLHQMIVRDPDFPQNPIKAMERGFEQAEKNFLEYAHSESNIESGSVQRSGSCAIVVLIVGEIAYVGNVGDSRAFMSTDSGTKIVPLSIDHKPESEDETARIEGNGGKVYQNQSYIPDPSPGNTSGTQTLIGPHRVFPGRLSVSRTIGDIEAKDVRYGGNPAVVIAKPEIRAFKIKDNFDFIAIGCDGVFEKMDNQEVMDAVWEAALQPENLKQPQSMHARCGASVDSVLNECVNQKTLDNITTVIIGFNNFEKLIDRARTTGGRNDRVRDICEAEVEDLDWEKEMAEVEDMDANPVLQKLMKPLEPVEEEMIENSELETPLSEVIEVTKKKAGSKGRLVEPPAESHNSSVSDRYASSSRRQSQLLETQDTQNLLDHELLDSNKISLRNSRTNLRNPDSDQPHLEQSRGGADTEEQAGIGLGKSSAQLHPNNEQSTGDQTQKSTSSTLVQKDYKIRQTSASPARVQRQNSDRTLRKTGDKATKQTAAPEGRSNTLPFTKGSGLHTTNVSASLTGGGGGPTVNSLYSSNTIPQTKTSKTPSGAMVKHSSHHHNTGVENSRNLLDSKSVSGAQTSNVGLSQSSHRPSTPKRVIVHKKPSSSQQPTAGGGAMASTSAQHQKRDSVKELAPLSAGTASKKNGSQSRRKEDFSKTDDQSAHTISNGKFTKKMVANWVGQPTGAGSQSSALISHAAFQGQSQRSGVPATDLSGSTSHKSNMINLSKSYMSAGSQGGSGAGGLASAKAQSSKNRTQRVTETIKNLISQSQITNSGNSRDRSGLELTKDQISDIAQQFNSFSSGQPPVSKQSLLTDGLNSGSAHQYITSAKTGSGAPLRPRKKSGSKAQGNSSTIGKQSLRMVPIADSNQTAASSVNFHHLPQTSKQRTSASRNKPSNLLQPGNSANIGPSGANSFTGAVAQNMNNTAGGLIGPSTNITLNFNQINLSTSGQSRQAQQPLLIPSHTNGSAASSHHHHAHHPTALPQGPGAGSLSGNSLGVGSSGLGGGQQKQWYSNTINLAGIKQISNSVIKQSSAIQKQGGGSQATGQVGKRQ